MSQQQKPAPVLGDERYAVSRDWHARAQHVLAGGVSSEFRKLGSPHPLFYAEASGSRVTDVDGNSYLDFSLSQGPMILGHSQPDLLRAIARALAQGQLFGSQYPAEVLLAERIQKLVPCAERLRFGLSGSEANQAAFRLARAYTGRPKILRFEGQYHGWLDNVASCIATPDLESLGPRENPRWNAWTQGLPERISEEVIVLPWNDLEAVSRLFQTRSHEIAAVITEPIMCNQGCILPQPEFLPGLRSLCDQHGALLIFDEVITGFRVALGGAQELLGVVPDLATFGKALASGFPISVLAGKAAFMELLADGRVIQAGTMNAGQVGVAAASATLDILISRKVPKRLTALGQTLMQAIRDVSAAAGRPAWVQGPGPMFHMGFGPTQPVVDYRGTFAYDKPAYARFVRGMQDRGIRLLGRGLWYLSAAHSEQDLSQALAAVADVLKEMK